MKKLLMSAAAISGLLIASPTFAATWQGHTYADGFAGYDINAPVHNFCAFGNEGNAGVAGTNTTNVQSGASHGGISTAEGDQTFTIDIQNDGDDTIQHAAGSFNFARAVCNTAFTVTGRSINGGLKSDHTTTDTDFATLVPYSIRFALDGVTTGSQTPVANTNVTLVSSSQAQAGPATFSFDVPARDQLALAGTYTDYVLITLAPNP